MMDDVQQAVMLHRQIGMKLPRKVDNNCCYGNNISLYLLLTVNSRYNDTLLP